MFGGDVGERDRGDENLALFQLAEFFSCERTKADEDVGLLEYVSGIVFDEGAGIGIVEVDEVGAFAHAALDAYWYVVLDKGLHGVGGDDDLFTGGEGVAFEDSNGETVLGGEFIHRLHLCRVFVILFHDKG